MKPPIPSSFHVDDDSESMTSNDRRHNQSSFSISNDGDPTQPIHQTEEHVQHARSTHLDILNGNVDDGESSVSSNSSGEFSSDDENDFEGGLSLQERAFRNQQRNELFLQNLQKKYMDRLPPNLLNSRSRRRSSSLGAGGSKSEDASAPALEQIPRGMIRRRTPGGNIETFEASIRHLKEKFPFRETQIRRLAAMLQPSPPVVSPSNRNAVMVPYPIFVTGPRGTGKTSILRDLLSALELPSAHTTGTRPTVERFVCTAFVDCLATEPSSIDRLVLDAYMQLSVDDYSAATRKNSTTKDADQEKSKRLRTVKYSHANDVTSEPNNEPVSTERMATSTKPSLSKRRKLRESDQRLQPRRAAKEETSGLKHVLADVDAPKFNGIQGNDNKKSSTVETSHSPVLSFGRSLKRLYGEGSNQAAILVIDNAERLLSLSAKKKPNEKTNCLAELLLLPKVARLNLRIIIISRYSILEGTKLNNLSTSSKASSSLSSAGIATVQFPAYSGNGVFKTILTSSKPLKTLVGSQTSARAATQPFMKTVIDAFVNAVVQVLIGSTRDINDFMRIGRSLWPLYMEPLSKEKVDTTLANLNLGKEVSTEESDVRIIEYLGKRLYTILGKVQSDLLELSLDSPLVPGLDGEIALPVKPCEIADTHEPFLDQCLLLAAFICQTNRADQDKKIFSAQGNGRRRSRQKAPQETKEETLAFGGTNSELENLKALRPRPFYLERVLSIFVTLVRLNPDCPPLFPGKERKQYSTANMGGERLYKALSKLVELGYLHPVVFSGASKGEQININGARYWCTLTKEEAHSIAKRVGIPLDSYLL